MLHTFPTSLIFFALRCGNDKSLHPSLCTSRSIAGVWRFWVSFHVLHFFEFVISFKFLLQSSYLWLVCVTDPIGSIHFDRACRIIAKMDTITAAIRHIDLAVVVFTHSWLSFLFPPSGAVFAVPSHAHNSHHQLGFVMCPPFRHCISPIPQKSRQFQQHCGILTSNTLTDFVNRYVLLSIFCPFHSAHINRNTDFRVSCVPDFWNLFFSWVTGCHHFAFRADNEIRFQLCMLWTSKAKRTG